LISSYFDPFLGLYPLNLDVELSYFFVTSLGIGVGSSDAKFRLTGVYYSGVA
jgi:hypothetical protein